MSTAHQVGQIYRNHSGRWQCIQIGQTCNLYQLLKDDTDEPDISQDEGLRIFPPDYLQPLQKPAPEPFYVGQTVCFWGDGFADCSGTIKRLNSHQAVVCTMDLGTKKMKDVPTPLYWLRAEL